MPAPGSKKPRTRFAKDVTPVDIRTIKMAFAARVVFTGNSYRITLPKREFEFWNLRTGDEILVEISAVKREPGEKYQNVIN